MTLRHAVCVALSSTVFALWRIVVLPDERLAQDVQRFVNPTQAKTFTDPQSKSQIKVLIDEQLGGTKDVTIAELVIPSGVDVPDHMHQSTEIFYILSGELE